MNRERQNSPTNGNSEKSTIPSAETEEQGVAEAAIATLKKEIEDAPIVGRSLAAIQGKELVIPITTATQKQRVLEALYDLNIFPWEENGVLIIEHRRDMQKLALAGLTSEPTPPPAVPLAEHAPELAFPLQRFDTLSEHLQKASKDRKDLPNEVRGTPPSHPNTREKPTGPELEPGMDTELRTLINRFDQGLIDESDEEFQRKIGAFPTLSLFPQQYVWQKGNPVEKRTGKVIAKEERNELYTIAKEGDVAAINTLMRMHTGLVIDAVVRCKEKFGGDPDDFFQEGMMGLVRAIEKYDLEGGAAFSTYAMYWIESRIRRYAYEQRFQIRRPAGLQQQQQKLQNLVGNQGTVESSADLPWRHRTALGTSVGRDHLMRRYLLNAAFDPISDDGVEVSEHAYDPIEPGSEATRGAPEATVQRQVEEGIKRALLKLTPREERVIRMRFGINTGPQFPEGQVGARDTNPEEGLTLEEIGNHFGVIRERIRQIEAKALRKMKHPAHSRALRRLFDMLKDDSERVDSPLGRESREEEEVDYREWKRLRDAYEQALQKREETQPDNV